MGVDINWGLLQPTNPGNAFLQGMEQGRERKREQQTQNVLAEVAKGWGNTGITADPQADEQQFNALIAPLMQFNPEMAIRLRQMRNQEVQGVQEQRAEQQAYQREQMVTAAKLLDDAVDEPTYQRSLAAARQVGIDVSTIPQQFDPEWVAQQRMIVSAFNKDGGQSVSGIARELTDAGYKPGTPEFADAMRGVIQNKYAAEYVDPQGNTRRRSALNLGGAPSSAPPPTPGIVEDGYRFKGGNPADPSAWEAVGGPTQPASGTFPGNKW